MTRQSSILKDTWGVVFLIAIPVILGILFIWYAFYQNYTTVFGRYHYTGTEEMSVFGLLDIAHYRNVATEELLGWQFFFGNMPFFVIYALMIAGYMHLARPKAVSEESKEPHDIAPGKGIKRTGVVCGIAVICIIVAEIVFSVAGEPQTGLGSHLFTGDFYRDIPTLLAEGYYNTNNIPSNPQMVLTLLPFACGLGILFYVICISVFRAQGMVSKKLEARPAAVILLVTAFAWWAMIAGSIEIRVQEAMTGYSAMMLMILFLNALVVAGITVPITRAMLPGSTRRPRPAFSPAPLFTAIIATVAMIVAGVLVLWPYLSFLDVDVPSIPGIQAYQGVALVAFFSLVAVQVVLVRRDHVEIMRVLSFFGGCFSFLMLLVYFAINPDGGEMEMMWLYNSIIPSIFINALVIAFYMLGFKLNEWIKRARSVIVRKAPRLVTVLKDHDKKRLEAIATAVLVSACAVAAPAIVGVKILGDHPQILINNVGMFPNQEKTFFFTLSNDFPGAAGTFNVIDASGTVVFSGDLVHQGFLWRRYHWKGDFSGLATPGTYRVVAQLGGHVATSNEFTIDPKYIDVARTLGLYWFYYARCGTKVEPVQYNAIGHEACHMHDAWYLYNNSGNYEYRHDLDLTGGWHDSGDYNTYGGMMAMAIYSLAYSMNQSTGFLNEPANKAAYPQNDSIPDICEEAWFGIQWWIKRFYEPERLFFDSNCLGENMSIRWTVFCPPEVEEDFGNGRWVVGDQPASTTYAEAYSKQFLKNSGALLPIASAAAMARQFKVHGYYLANITQLETFANKTRHAYKNYLNGDWASIACEMEMYRLTRNMTYFNNARNYVNSVIAASGSLGSFPGDYRQIALAIQCAREFNGTGGWNGLGYLAGNQTIDHLAQYLSARTDDARNYFNYLRYAPSSAPVAWNFEYLNAIFAASYAYNFSTNNTTRKTLYNFMTRHFDWLFGRNMENTCMMERLPGGDVFVQDYFTRQRFIPGNLHGAFPGSIADGFQYFPGDYSGWGYDNSLSNAEKNPAIPKRSNIYSETWSYQANSFQLAIGAFFSQVLGRA